MDLDELSFWVNEAIKYKQVGIDEAIEEQC